MVIVNSKQIKAKILIIDDNPESVDILVNAIPKSYRRQVALNGKTALKILNSSDDLPDLILLDVMMQDMDGYEVCMHIKADKRLKDIPIIFLSALDEARDKIKAFSSGGADYITKPFRIMEVQARVKTHLKIHFLQTELENQNKKLKEIVDKKVKEISESQLETIYALAKLSESRDDIAGGHIERVQKICRLLARHLGAHSGYGTMTNTEFVKCIHNASSLHDIGKVGIRDDILLKPGRLTDSEFGEVKKHTIIGANTLREVYRKYPYNIFIKIGIEVAQSHHEKWDGSGYPDGLAGEQIPFPARIMAIADVYDALLSKRPYKDVYSLERAHNIIIEGSGSHFDPAIVKAFLAIEKNINIIYADTSIS